MVVSAPPLAKAGVDGSRLRINAEVTPEPDHRHPRCASLNWLGMSFDLS